DTIYVERAIRRHPRAIEILERFSSATVIECDRYGEVFNRRAQNFRLQKQRPALILAEKSGRKVLPTPPGYTIGRSDNRYFSHMLNCLYDCRYCFLQGMYQSAHYVLFVNWEEFEQEIDSELAISEDEVCFFSGYDCDSLAMESITGFAEHFVPFFSNRPEAWIELRTKSLNTRVLEQNDPVPNVVMAYTLTPAEIAIEIEHGAPSFEKRLNRVRSLTQQGWMVGLRLDPLIPWPGFSGIYREMVERVFREVNSEKIHSVTLGPMRFPKAMHDRIIKLYPEDRLFALEEMTLRDGQMSYPSAIEEELVSTVVSALAKHLPDSKIFRQTG
ncbi:MAG: spore photoproduct lyase family protein, partial [Verrucomicrobiota bacterium]